MLLWQSTDGHVANWAFNTTRLNLQLALQAASHTGRYTHREMNRCRDAPCDCEWDCVLVWLVCAGAVVVDSTRKGKVTNNTQTATTTKPHRQPYSR
jgi:hypothetical protein